MRPRPNPSLEPTRYGRHCLAAPGQHIHCPCAAKQHLPPRGSARTLARISPHRELSLTWFLLGAGTQKLSRFLLNTDQADEF